MKIQIPTTLAAAAAAAFGATSAMALVAPGVGDPAPGFAAQDANGKPVKLSDFRGKTLVLEWTNSGCPYVRHEYDSGVMQGLQKRAAVQGITWLTVISSAPGQQGFLKPTQVAAWRAQSGAAPSDVLLDADGRMGRTYGATATPTLFIIDPKGVLIYEGGIDDRPSTRAEDAKTAKNYIAAALSDLHAGRPIAISATRPYGCSVKYAGE